MEEVEGVEEMNRIQVMMVAVASVLVADVLAFFSLVALAEGVILALMICWEMALPPVCLLAASHFLAEETKDKWGIGIVVVVGILLWKFWAFWVTMRSLAEILFY